MINLANYSQLSIYNRKALEQEDNYSCYFCFRYGNTSDIEEWCDNQTTGLCSFCGMDTLLPGTVDKGLLEAINEKAFKVVKNPNE